jgi:cytochrome c oxidase subunit II
VIGALALLGPVLPGGVPTPSALRPAAPQAAGLEGLWWFMLWTCTAVFVLVLAALTYAMLRRRWAQPPGRRAAEIITGAAAVTVVILFSFLVATVVTARRSPNAPQLTDRIVQVVGHQWWWEVHYPGSRPDEEVVSANEIHLPAGRDVVLDLTSADVIHSFWAPNLHGKRDLIPGRHNFFRIRPEKVGTYRGQCAEFCGYQHAHMGFIVYVESPDKFEEYLASQRKPAPDPLTADAARGRQVFLTNPCVTCHTIRGTGASGTNAPDLTHLASRRTIAAATVDNTPGHLGGWIADSQGIKPGNHMPPHLVSSEDLLALVAYLRSLS